MAQRGVELRGVVEHRGSRRRCGGNRSCCCAWAGAIARSCRRRALEQAAHAGLGADRESVVPQDEARQRHRVDLVDALAGGVVLLAKRGDAAGGEGAIQPGVGQQADDLDLDGLDALAEEARVEAVELVEVGFDREQAGLAELFELGGEVGGDREDVLDTAALAVLVAMAL